ncbi:MAG: peptidase C39 family protein [Methanomassiliicoccales archaeon]
MASPGNKRVPRFYRQTMDFTCGAACLLMALNFFEPAFALTPENEVDIWREGNLIPAMGMGRYGIALILLRRQCTVRILSTTADFEFSSRIRARLGDNQYSQFRLLAQERMHRAKMLGLKEQTVSDITVRDLDAVKRGSLVFLLTDASVLGDETAPHWILIYGMDHEKLYFHNPLASEGGTAWPLTALENLSGFAGEEVMIEASPISYS